MIKHIVMWKFKPDTEEQVNQFIEGLKSLDGVIPQIKKMEVAKNCNPANTFDAVLISEFETMEDMETYKNDPRHVEVSNLCKSIRLERVAVDYEF